VVGDEFHQKILLRFDEIRYPSRLLVREQRTARAAFDPVGAPGTAPSAASSAPGSRSGLRSVSGPGPGPAAGAGSAAGSGTRT
jgi:hypothetical protein